MEVARRSEKPILAFKSNIGKLGQNIALSHTASLASDDKVVDAAFHQSGIIRVRDATTLGNNLKILGLPPMRGKNLGVISRSGGHAVIAADACELSGFELARFPDSFLREIEKHFRASVIKLTNPLDLGDLFNLDVYAQIIERTLQLDDVDGIVFLHTSLSDQENQTSRQLLERIMELVKQYDKPVAYYISTASQEVTYLKQNYHFPIFTQVVETVRALEMSHYYCKQYQSVHAVQELPDYAVDKSAVKNLIDQASAERRDLLLHESLEALQHYGIPVIPSKIAKSKDEVAAAAEGLGFPLAMKIVARGVSHKSDVGGVKLNLQSEAAVLDCYEEMIRQILAIDPAANIEGVLLQPMIDEGREMILGGRQDPQFGPVVLVGLGGIFVEVFDETQVRVAPISRDVALEMVENLRGAQILKGTRGEKPADIDALIDAMMRLSRLLCDFPAIKELDINPLRIFSASQGVSALDARIILG
jgi:acetyltransferase